MLGLDENVEKCRFTGPFRQLERLFEPFFSSSFFFLHLSIHTLSWHIWTVRQREKHKDFSTHRILQSLDPVVVIDVTSNNGGLPMSTQSGGVKAVSGGEREREENRQCVLKSILASQKQSFLWSEREAERFYPVPNPHIWSGRPLTTRVIYSLHFWGLFYIYRAAQEHRGLLRPCRRTLRILTRNHKPIRCSFRPFRVISP